jgi:hypothetical protein
MSKLNTSDYNNVLDLIEAVYATPNVPGVSRLTAGSCGYSVNDIIASLRLRSPENTMSDADVANMLIRGTRSGVFNVYYPDIASASTTVVWCNASEAGEPVYFVNQNMVRVNPANKVYADAFNAPTVNNQILEVGFGISSKLSCQNVFTRASFNPIGSEF